MSDSDEDYTPPQYVINEWAKQCYCCSECNPHPCDGVIAGGVCDHMPCECNGEYDEVQDEW